MGKSRHGYINDRSFSNGALCGDCVAFIGVRRGESVAELRTAFACFEWCDGPDYFNCAVGWLY